MYTFLETPYILQNKGKMKFFSVIQRLKEWMTSRPILQEMLKEIFRQKEKDTGGNTGLPKEMKNTGNDRNMEKHTSFFLI